MKRGFLLMCVILFFSYVGFNLKFIQHQETAVPKMNLILLQTAKADDEGSGGNLPNKECGLDTCSRTQGEWTYQGHYQHCKISNGKWCDDLICWTPCDAGTGG